MLFRSGTIADLDGAQQLAKLGVRLMLTNVAPWIESGARLFAAELAKGSKAP